MPAATIRLGDGQYSSARLQTISVKGGMLRVLKPLSTGEIVELMFFTHSGPVLGMAKMLSPCAATPVGLQPFRFLAVDKVELRKLRTAIAESCKPKTESPSTPPWRA